jgi:hypothetical protein
MTLPQPLADFVPHLFPVFAGHGLRVAALQALKKQRLQAILILSFLIFSDKRAYVFAYGAVPAILGLFLDILPQ